LLRRTLPGEGIKDEYDDGRDKAWKEEVGQKVEQEVEDSHGELIFMLNAFLKFCATGCRRRRAHGSRDVVTAF
jgi:hypothetical protein